MDHSHRQFWNLEGSSLFWVLLVAVFISIASIPSKPSSHIDVGSRATSSERQARILQSNATTSVEITNLNNLDDPLWNERLEVKVKNVSTKPVYFLEIVLLFPDIVNTQIDGAPRSLVLPLTYGRRDLMKKGNRAKPEDSET